MSIEILCRLGGKINRTEIIEFIENGVYFNDKLSFIPLFSSQEINDDMWSILEIHYQKDKKPIVIERYTKNIKNFAEIVSEKYLAVKEINDEDLFEIENNIQKSEQVFFLSFDALSIDEDCWAMLDSLESYLAKRFNGLIFSSEGLYDQNLVQIADFEGATNVV